MVALVDVLVDVLVMEKPMDPVYEAIREENKRHDCRTDGPPTCKRIETVLSRQRVVRKEMK